jgi:hypothetical protein
MRNRIGMLFGVVVWVSCNCGGPGPADGGEAGSSAGGGGGAGASGGGSAGRSWSFRFTPDGGTFVAGLFTLTLPEGALASAVDVTVREDTRGTVPGMTLTSPLYFFEPAGLTFTDAVHVQVEVSDPDVGLLRWSSDDGGFDESIGWVAGGVGEGYTRHFSSAYTAKGACIDPQGPGRSECDCRATDCQGDLLSKQPPSGTACGNFPTETKWAGADGGACSGFGPRTLVVWQCSCMTAQNARLCPRRWVGTPLQSVCPGGTATFDGGPPQNCDGGPTVENRACSGFLQTPFNTVASGRFEGCGPAAVDTTWEEVNGVLEGCVDLNLPLPAGTMVCPPGTPQRDRISQACHEALSQYDAGPACPGVGNAAVVGTRLGQQIEAQYNKPPDQLTQLAVPGASKSNNCKSGNDGFPDLTRISERTATSITVQLGDVKPLTRSGLGKGIDDVYTCYQRDFQTAANKCAPGMTRTADDTMFCNRIGALNRTVKVDTSGNLGFSSGQFCGQSLDGGALKVEAIECQPGITAYRCLP